jgi:hypothetical protein
LSNRSRRTVLGLEDPAGDLVAFANKLRDGEVYVSAAYAAELTGMSINVLSKLAHVAGKVRFRRPLADLVPVYLKKFPDRDCYSLQWWDPSEKKMKTQTTKTRDPAKGEELRAFMQDVLNADGEKREQVNRLEVNIADLISYLRKRAQAGALPYRRHSYTRAINRACKRAGVVCWSPLQLRHTAATIIRRQYGLEAAQLVLGHSRADVTQLYAERDSAKAEQIIAAVG